MRAIRVCTLISCLNLRKIGRRAALRWGGLGLVMTVPVLLATQSPYLQWRDWVYVAGGFAGILALSVMVLQAVLAAGVMPALSRPRALCLHRWGGAVLVLCVILHVGGLWITSPPDVIDVLLLRSPTPFGLWGALAMWAIFAAGLFAVFRRQMPPRLWSRCHGVATALAVLATVLHAVLIEGAMEPWSKAGICLAAIFTAAYALRARRMFR